MDLELAVLRRVEGPGETCSGTFVLSRFAPFTLFVFFFISFSFHSSIWHFSGQRFGIITFNCDFFLSFPLCGQTFFAMVVSVLLEMTLCRWNYDRSISVLDWALAA